MSYTPREYKCLGILKSANLNSTADQAIGIAGSQKYIVDKIVATNTSTTLATSIAAGGFYTGASKSGTTIVGAGQLYTALTGATKFSALTLALTTDTLTAQTIYFSLTTAHGTAATIDLYVWGYVLE